MRRDRQGGLSLTVGEFFAEHRKVIDARKAHLARVGAGAPEPAPIRDALNSPPSLGASATTFAPRGAAMPSQADVLVPPPVVEAPLIDATHAPMTPATPPAEYQTPKLPKLPGVNIQVHEE